MFHVDSCFIFWSTQKKCFDKITQSTPLYMTVNSCSDRSIHFAIFGCWHCIQNASHSIIPYVYFFCAYQFEYRFWKMMQTSPLQKSSHLHKQNTWNKQGGSTSDLVSQDRRDENPLMWKTNQITENKISRELLYRKWLMSDVVVLRLEHYVLNTFEWLVKFGVCSFS